MNDRFKFRARHDKSGKWYYFTFDSLIGDGGGDVSVDENAYGVSLSDCSIKNQCTGLKDKNGKLIFEGDIVRIGVEKYLVESLQDFFESKGLKEGEFGEDWSCDNFEIIGNIYENPELLKNEP